MNLTDEENKMRVPLIAGNWKMNTTVIEAVNLVKEMRDDLEKIPGVDKVICPPFISLAPLKEMVQGSTIKLGAQNLYFAEKGAYTGEISPLMLAALCEYVIIGHSERRQYFGENGDMVNKKVVSALKAGLIPILCIGEKLEENEAGKTEEVVTGQLNAALENIDDIDGLILAYEPVWAIGTGRAATGERANETIAIIRNCVSGRYDRGISREIRILYGGSVTAANTAEYMDQPDIDGALVGGASLKASEFISIVTQASTTR